MSRDDIINLAREAGIEFQELYNPALKRRLLLTCGGQMIEKMERFAALVAAAEREASAKVCEQQIERWVDDRARYAASECAIGIRAKGQS